MSKSQTPTKPKYQPHPLTDREELRQTVTAILPDLDTIAGRRSYADWLAANGWTEDAERVRNECEIEELRTRLNDLETKQRALTGSTWKITIGGKTLSINVINWKHGLPDRISLDWETLSIHGDEIARLAPVKEVVVQQPPPNVKYTKTVCQVKDAAYVVEEVVEIEGPDGRVWTGKGSTEQDALYDAMGKCCPTAKVANWYPGAISSGVVGSFHLASGACVCGYISSSWYYPNGQVGGSVAVGTAVAPPASYTITGRS